MNISNEEKNQLAQTFIANNLDTVRNCPHEKSILVMTEVTYGEPQFIWSYGQPGSIRETCMRALRLTQTQYGIDPDDDQIIEHNENIMSGYTKYLNNETTSKRTIAMIFQSRRLEDMKGSSISFFSFDLNDIPEAGEEN